MSRIALDTVVRELKTLYPKAGCTLDYTTPIDLLVATILSAQCTDKRVNIVTKSLFKKYKTPADYVRVSAAELEKDIHSCGTYRMKAKAIQASAKTMLDLFGGEVPRTMDEMLLLRGVGRKTAAVVLSTVYGVLDGIAVDTHVNRVSRRLGLTRSKTQARIEADLMRITPRKQWADISHLLIAHGRSTCSARAPKCEACVFCSRCPSSTVRSGKHG